MKSVYLAGPIAGLTYDGAQDWRQSAQSELQEHGIQCYSPLRCKSFLRSTGIIEGSYEDHPLSSARGIMTRDHHDVFTCDLLLVNFLGAERVSIGTCMEIAWAYAYKKPVVCLMEARGSIHDHPMITEALGYLTDDIVEALDIVKAVLLP